jgi:amidase/aspartyl-tRNA(Asn)/glutamyl-tRNA(Gln) amidotransferase subunit A
METDLVGRSATELAALIRHRTVTPRAVVDAHLDRIAETNDALNAFVTVIGDDARERADAAEAALDSGEPIGPLHGVPIAIKDLFDFKAGVKNTFGAKPFAGFEPRQTALYVDRLESAGAIVLGKTNTPEFGYKATTDNLLWGPTSTPFDTDANAGGSSGGSAAAVATGMVPLAQGTDGAGSLRIPAAFCGVVGYKPSFGRIPQQTRPDAFVSHTPFIHVGPLARTVADAALFTEAIAGPHPSDPWSLPDDGTEYVAATTRDVDDLAVAYSPDLGCFPVADAVAAVAADAVDAFEDAGATVDHVDVEIDADRERMEAVILAELGLTNVSVVESFADSGIDLLDEHRGALPADFVAMVEDAQSMDVVAYKRSEFVRTAVYDAIQSVFADYDVLVTPTTCVPSIPNADDGQTTGPDEVDGEPVEPLLGWSLAYPFNFTGHPAASLPAGQTSDGMPVGLQLVGKRHADETLLAASAAFERTRPWHESYDAL